MTLAEMIVTISIMLLGLSAVFVNIHHRPSQGAAELARQVVNELRNLRKGAMTSGSPRAFCIPTGNASTPIAQSYYILRGHGRTLPRSVTDTSKQCPGTYLFVGLFGSAPESITSLVHPAPAYPPVSPAEPPFLAATWMNPVVRDFAFIFTPDGRLATNDLPHDAQGTSYIVVADGLDFAAAGPPAGTATMGSEPPPYFQLTAANNCYTVKIGSSGAISLMRGLPNPASSVALNPTPQAAPSLAPAPPVTLSGVNNPPVVDRITSIPIGNPANLPFDTTVSQDGRVSLTMFAYDPDGDDLSYKFACTALDGTPPGKFTYLTDTRNLHYPKYSDVGQARVDWVPPANAPVGARFDLDAIVTDESNQSASSTGTVTVTVRLQEDGTIAYDSNGDIWTMKGDGTLPANKTRGLGVNSWPDLTSNGRRIVFVSTRPLTYHDSVHHADVTLSVKRIWSMNIDGSDAEALTNVDGSTQAKLDATKDSTDDCPCWSPDGAKVAFARTNAGVSKIQIINADGSWDKHDLDEGTAPSWARKNQPGDKNLLYEKGADIFQSTASGPGTALITGASKPVWCADGTRILYVAGGNLMECQADGSSPITKFAGTSARVAVKPKGDHFVGVVGGAPVLYKDPGLSSAASSTPFQPPSMPYPFTGSLSWALAR
ncbi:MAG: PD40 domain-containing protein [Candidatus Eremiobacteraeota bacterium]|nr:PD40 domain-containing protein [Candidatus Eremiobacteraeota bacterium]